MLGTFGAWMPPATVSNHGGEPLEQDLSFFAPPPPEIGKVLTAYSELKADKNPNSLSNVFLLAGFFGIAVALGFYLSSRSMFGSPFKDIGIGGLIGAVIGAVIGFWIRNYESCGYVGERGVARYYYNPDPIKAQKGTVFLFDTATELRAEQTRNYTNFVYTGTSYDYSWKNAGGKNIFTLMGSYKSEKTLPTSTDRFHFACSAETAWTNHLLTFAEMEWQRAGAVRFYLRGSDFLLLGQGWIEITKSGKTHRCAVDDIGSFAIEKGVVKLKTKDARAGFFGLGSSGIYAFDYKDLANAKLFLILLNRLVVSEGELERF